MDRLADLYRRVFHQNKDAWKTDLLIIGGVLLIVLIFVIWRPELPGKEDVEAWSLRFGGFGPLTIIAVITLETVIAPIPGTIIPIVVGVLYGVWPGILYAWIGNVLGSTIAFWLSRRFGRPLVERFAKTRQLKKYDRFIFRNRLLVWLVYAIPIFPIDMISFIIGLSNMKYKRFLLIVSVGFGINLSILTFFGQRLLDSSGVERLLYAFGVIVVILIATTVEKLITRDDD